MHTSIAFFRRLVAIKICLSAMLIGAVSWAMAHHSDPAFVKILVQIWLSLLAFFIAWLGFDAAFCFKEFKKIRPFVNHDGFLRLFFLDGASSQYLRSLASDVEPFRRTVMDEIAKLPALQGKRLEVIFENEGADKAFVFIDRVKQDVRARLAGKLQEDRRSARRDRKMQKLVDDGLQLGFSKEAMELLAVKTPEEIQAAFAKKTDTNELVFQAAAEGIDHLVESAIAVGDTDEARRILSQTRAFFARAKTFGHDVEMRVRREISARNFTLAERILGEAVVRNEADEIVRTLAARIDELPVHRRPKPRELLSKLREEQFGTRGFRKARYDVEQSIGAR